MFHSEAGAGADGACVPRRRGVRGASSDTRGSWFTPDSYPHLVHRRRSALAAAARIDLDCSARPRPCTWVGRFHSRCGRRVSPLPPLRLVPAGMRRAVLRGRGRRDRHGATGIDAARPGALLAKLEVDCPERRPARVGRCRSMSPGRNTLVLGIETSCETATALVMGGNDILPSFVSSQSSGSCRRSPASHLQCRASLRQSWRPADGERMILAATGRSGPRRRPARRRVGREGVCAGVGRPIRHRQPPSAPLRRSSRRPRSRCPRWCCRVRRAQRSSGCPVRGSSASSARRRCRRGVR